MMSCRHAETGWWMLPLLPLSPSHGHILKVFQWRQTTLRNPWSFIIVPHLFHTCLNNSRLLVRLFQISYEAERCHTSLRLHSCRRQYFPLIQCQILQFWQCVIKIILSFLSIIFSIRTRILDFFYKMCIRWREMILLYVFRYSVLIFSCFWAF